MPRKKKASKKPKLVLKSPSKQVLEVQDLEAYIREAGEVKATVSTGGWAILERDLLRIRESIVPKLAYTNPKNTEFYEAQLLYVGIDKLLALIEDYATNRDKAIEHLNKLQNPELAVTMDVDLE